jgi:hypothetical protein
MIRMTILALGAVAAIGVLLPTIALAGDRDFVPPSSSYPVPGYPLAGYPFADFGYNGYFGEPALSGGYHGDGSCILVPHRVRERHGWRVHVVQVCG